MSKVADFLFKLIVGKRSFWFKGQTSRGFKRWGFQDSNGHRCSLQSSSVATEDMIWLGIDDADPQIMATKVPDKEWKKRFPKDQSRTGFVPYVMNPEVLLTTRMHLSRSRVRKLILPLIKFWITGNL